MTPAERIQAEQERVLSETGFYIPPYRMANLLKAASKMVDAMVKADTYICYQECEIMLDMAARAIRPVLEDGRDIYGNKG